MKLRDFGSVETFSLTDLAQKCREETDKFFKQVTHDVRYCFEIFRRAIEHRQDEAWEYIYVQYRPLFTSWITRHASFSNIEEELDDILNEVYLKAFNVLTPEKFRGFENLKSVLRYIQTIVSSVLFDRLRKVERHPDLVPLEDGDDEVLRGGTTESAETLASQEMFKHQAWQAIEAQLNNERERIVMLGLFSVGLKPREIQARYPDLFPGSKDVSRVKENVLLRLSRNSEFLDAFKKIA